MVIILLSACNQSPEPSNSKQASPTETLTQKNEQSKYGSYSAEDVQTRISELKTILDNDHLFLPAAVKEAQSFLAYWDKNPETLKEMMESDLAPDNMAYHNDSQMDMIEDEYDMPIENSLNVRANIYGRESQSAFNIPGAIEYMLEIQSTDDQKFILQGLKVNRGHCGFYTGDFKSKLPVTMGYSSTVSYLLQCRGDQVIDIELLTDRGNFKLDLSGG